MTAHCRARLTLPCFLVYYSTAAALVAAPIHDAVTKGDLARVEALLAGSPQLVSSANPQGATPLHIAAARNDGAMIAFLIGKGARHDIRTGNGDSPLHWAAGNNADKAITALLDAGAPIQATANDGATPLRRALQKKAKAAADVILRRATPADTMQIADSFLRQGGNAPARSEIECAAEVLRDIAAAPGAGEHTLLAYGLACVALRSHADAETVLSQVLRANPGNDRARLELGNTYAALGRKDDALREFRLVLSHNPPEPVQRNVKQYIQNLSTTTSGWRFSKRIDAGWFADDNVNVGPDSETVRIAPIVFGSQTFTSLTVGPDSQPIDSSGLFGSVMASGQKGGNAQWGPTVGFAYYQNAIADASAHESRYAQVSAGTSRAAGRKYLALPLNLSRIDVGGDTLVDTFGIGPRYVFALGEAGSSVAETVATLESRDYDTLNDRDGVYLDIAEILTRPVSGGKHALTLEIGVCQDRTKERVYEYTGWRSRVGMDLNLGWNMQANASLRYGKTNYAEKESLAPEKRSDSQNQITIGLRKTLTPRWSVSVTEQVTDNTSTFDLYQYDRNVLTFNTTCVF